MSNFRFWKFMKILLNPCFIHAGHPMPNSNAGEILSMDFSGWNMDYRDFVRFICRNLKPNLTSQIGSLPQLLRFMSLRRNSRRGWLVSILVHQPRLHPGPPLIVNLTQLIHDFGILSDHVCRFTRVGLEVEKLLPILVIHQGEAFVLDGNSGVFRLGGLTR